MTGHVPTYPTCDATCTTDCGHCKGNHEQARLGQIRARADAATPGPWGRSGLSSVEGSHAMFHRVGPGADVPDAIVLTNIQPDAEFVANAPTDVTYLLGLLAEKDATIQRVASDRRGDAVQVIADRIICPECGSRGSRCQVRTRFGTASGHHGARTSAAESILAALDGQEGS